MKKYILRVMTKQAGIYKDIGKTANSFEEVKRIFLEDKYITGETKIYTYVFYQFVKAPIKDVLGKDWKKKIMNYNPDQWYDTFFGKYWYRIEE